MTFRTLTIALCFFSCLYLPRIQANDELEELFGGKEEEPAAENLVLQAWATDFDAAMKAPQSLTPKQAKSLASQSGTVWKTEELRKLVKRILAMENPKPEVLDELLLELVTNRPKEDDPAQLYGDVLRAPLLQFPQKPTLVVRGLELVTKDPALARRVESDIREAMADGLPPLQASRIAHFFSPSKPDLALALSNFAVSESEDPRILHNHLYVLDQQELYGDMLGNLVVPDKPTKQWEEDFRAWRNKALLKTEAYELYNKEQRRRLKQNRKQRSTISLEAYYALIEAEQWKLALPYESQARQAITRDGRKDLPAFSQKTMQLYLGLGNPRKAREQRLEALFAPRLGRRDYSSMMEDIRKLTIAHPELPPIDTNQLRTRLQKARRLNRSTTMALRMLKNPKRMNVQRDRRQPNKTANSRDAGKNDRASMQALADDDRWVELEQKILPLLRNHPEDLKLILLRGEALEALRRQSDALDWYLQASMAVSSSAKRESLYRESYRLTGEVEGPDAAKRYLNEIRRAHLSSDMRQWLDQQSRK